MSFEGETAQDVQFGSFHVEGNKIYFRVAGCCQYIVECCQSHRDLTQALDIRLEHKAGQCLFSGDLEGGSSPVLRSAERRFDNLTAMPKLS